MSRIEDGGAVEAGRHPSIGSDNLTEALRKQAGMVASGWTVYADAALLSKAAREIERLAPYEEELRNVAEDLGDPDDPFAAWESIQALTAEITRLRAENAGMREALEPFAAVAEHDIGETETDLDLFRPMSANNHAPKLTVGDLRRARAAFSKASQAEGQTR